MPDGDPYREYLDQVRQLPLVATDQLPALRDRALAGDTDAGKLVVQCHLEVAALLAWHLRPSSLAPIDAVQEANVILVRLVNDPTCDVPTLDLASALHRHFRSLPGV